MVQVQVAGVALDQSGQHVILLRPVDAVAGVGRVLPIWIGSLEATAILIALEHAEVPRPLTHDLMKSLLDELGTTVEKVTITHIDDGTFYAEITLHAHDGLHVVDSRPSDAVALASRASAPIWVDDDVLAEAGVDDLIGEAETEHDVAEFTKFLDDVDPDDFKKE